MATSLSGTAATPVWVRGAGLVRTLIGSAERWLAPVLFLAIRFWMAEIFFRSGLLKIQNLSSATFLFSEVHPVPFLPAWLAAYLATTVELVCPVLLVLGLAARFAALPMLAMAFVIQFVVGAADPAFDLVEHYYWMFLLGIIITKGPERLSLDHLIARRFGVPERHSPA
jgi:putative oxidoreductase